MNLPEIRKLGAANTTPSVNTRINFPCKLCGASRGQSGMRLGTGDRCGEIMQEAVSAGDADIAATLKVSRATIDRALV